MKLNRAYIEDNQYLPQPVEIKPNQWITEIPYAIQQNVFIQDFQNNVAFGWVGSHVTQDTDGNYKISGLEGGIGARPLKCWMKIALPFEDMTGWHSEYVEDGDFPRKKNHQYLVCVEIHAYGRTTYELRIARYSPSKKGDWMGFDAADRTRNVIAWRKIPYPTRKAV